VKAQVKFQQALYFNSNLKIAKQGLWLAQLQQNKKVKAVSVGVLSVSLSVLIWLLLVIISPYNATVAPLVLSFYPNDANLHANLGVALHQKGKLEKARVHYQEAIRLNPKLIYVYNNLGIILEEGGQLEEAIVLLKEGVRFNSQDAVIRDDVARVYYNLGIYLDKQGKQQEAIAAYREAIRLGSQSIHTYNNLGNLVVLHSKENVL
jgi:Flp pilus assembly protein TadD